MPKTMKTTLAAYLLAGLPALLLTGCAGSSTPLPVDLTNTVTTHPTSTPIPTPTAYDKIPEQFDDGLPTGSLAEAGIDSLKLSRMLETIYHGPASGDSLTMQNGRTKYQNIDSILIVKNGVLVFEEYFYHNDLNDRHIAASVSKSITSLLVGQAIAEGTIDSVEEKALVYFPDYEPADPAMEAITIEDLLTMQHGITCDDWNPDLPTYWQQDLSQQQADVLAYLFSFPMETSPGNDFHYCSLSTVMLGGILSRASGMSVAAFANQHLFTPMGITAYWTSKPPNWADTGGGLLIRPRDMAKIGLLMLHQGEWGGEQLVPAEWIATSSGWHASIPGNVDWGYRYGYLWWISDVRIGGTLVHSISASGAGGQAISIYPDLDMVVVFTGSNYENDPGYPITFMDNYILPAVIP